MVSQIVRGLMYRSYGGPISGGRRRKFKSVEINRIREAAQAGADNRTLAEQYDTTDTIIRQIVAGMTYPTNGRGLMRSDRG